MDNPSHSAITSAFKFKKSQLTLAFFYRIKKPPLTKIKTMARLTTVDESALSKTSLELLEPTRINGRLADVYLQFANSEPALAAYMQMEESLRQGDLSDQELEAIKLAVSEITQCEFCLAVHSMKATKLGLDTDAQLAIRGGQSTDNKKIDVMLEIVRHFFEKPGPLDDQLISKAKTQGLSDAALVDLTMAVSTIFFTNITNHINNTLPSLPTATPLPKT